ncbi:ESX-1 secretion-associated protein [Actinokineospora sp. PR83]|uniref:type VII secretion target n=1 Tax=Actinokineospora sp. PR83 TaxID=2884908 RepID=UPI001F3EA1C5|nr:type VII secretion target [Actinokineospora sp. PR83]MCG8918611.1 ESX-1 secretion-associated protein [Actinokineospora sp. PR83]
MPDGYDVLPDELRNHAGKLAALGERLGTAVDAASQVTLGTQAYGVICQFFVPVVQAVSQPGVDALAEAAGSMDATANGVRANAVSYDTTEQANTRPFTGGR